MRWDFSLMEAIQDRRVAPLDTCFWSAVLLAVLPATPVHGQGLEAWQPPTLTTVRYDEDWYRLADRAERTGRWTEPFKYIPLNDDGAYLVTGVELRARTEMYSNNLWGGADAPDDGFLWLRALPYADVHFSRFRAFVQPIAAYAIGVSPAASPVDRTGIDLLQGFADVRFGAAHTGDAEGLGVTLRVGRELMSFGNERLIGTRYGPNVPQAFDGVRAIVSLPGAVVSVMDKRPVRQGLGDGDDRTDGSRRLSGVYATIPHGKGGVDLYWLRYRNSSARFQNVEGLERRCTLGARIHGSAADWHWDVEAAYQYGRLERSRIDAWTASLEIGRNFPDAMFSPDVMVRVNIASGDEKPGDGRLGTFNALFPRGKHFGELSPVGPDNLVNINPRITIDLANNVSATVNAMGYWRYSGNDGIYDIPGNLIRASNGSKARSIGRQVEGMISWQATPELEISGSLSAFSAGAFLRETGAYEPIGMAAIETNFRF